MRDMKGKHTSGPWKKKKPYNDRWEHEIVDSKGQEIAVIRFVGPHQSINESAANASLIVNAPELYDILIKLLNSLEEAASDRAVESGLGVSEWESFLSSEKTIAAFRHANIVLDKIDSE